MTRTSGRYLAAVVTATAGYFLLSTQTQAVFYDAVGLSAAAAMLLGIRRYRPEPQTAWLLLAFGVLALVAGDIVYGESQPVPSPADMLYISGYALLVLGMIGLIPGRRRERPAPSLIVAGCTAASVGLVSWMFLLAPSSAGIGLSTMAVSVGYPVLDLVLIGALVLAMRRAGGTSSFRILGTALLLFLVADSVFALQDFGTAYVLGGTGDALWLLAYGCFGAALLHPSVRGGLAIESVAVVGRGAVTALGSLRFRSVIGTTGRLVLGLAVIALFLGASRQSVGTIVLAGSYGMVGSLLMLGASSRV